MECTFQVHRTGAAVDRWDTIGVPNRDCGRLAERARRLCILLQMRPQEGCDGVRVMHGAKQVTIFTIDMELVGRRRARKARSQAAKRPRPCPRFPMSDPLS